AVGNASNTASRKPLAPSPGTTTWLCGVKPCAQATPKSCSQTSSYESRRQTIRRLRASKGRAKPVRTSRQCSTRTRSRGPRSNTPASGPVILDPCANLAAVEFQEHRVHPLRRHGGLAVGFRGGLELPINIGLGLLSRCQGMVAQCRAAHVPPIMFMKAHRRAGKRFLRGKVDQRTLDRLTILLALYPQDVFHRPG